MAVSQLFNALQACLGLLIHCPKIMKICFLCRIGTEHEKLVFRQSDNRPAEYSDIQYILNGLVSRRHLIMPSPVAIYDM